MPVKPILMSDIRKANPPSPMDTHREKIGNGTYNRFAPLFERPRLLSQGKRQRSEDDIPATTATKVPRLDANKVFDQMSAHDEQITKVKSALKTASEAAQASFKPDDNGIGTVMYSLVEAVQHIANCSEVMKSALVDFCKQNESPRTPVLSSAGPDLNTQGPQGTWAGKVKNTKPTQTPVEVETDKVKKVLKEAEKKTVLFELDLGSAPTINRTTLSRKVTMALHAKAATGNHDWNTADAGEMVDDLLSCAQLEFLGNGSRKFFNSKKPTDPRNNNMCTLPVRLDFKNKESRIRAEETLRKVCKVSCSTPYPKRLRDLLTQAIRAGKEAHPNCFIRTKVNSDNLKIEVSARTEGGWVQLPTLGRDIPIDILDRNPLNRLRLESNASEVIMDSQQTPLEQASL